jgi:hypothetical protein
MTLELRRTELHEKAQNLAFHYYIRSGIVPPLVAGIVAVTSSPEAFKTALPISRAFPPAIPMAGNGRAGMVDMAISIMRRWKILCLDWAQHCSRFSVESRVQSAGPLKL